MSELHEGENGSGVPSYLESLRGTEDKIEKLAGDWREEWPYLRELMLSRLGTMADNGISLTLSANPHEMLVVLRTTRYGYEARYCGDCFGSIAEQMNNDLDCRSVPWREDWRRKRENSKRLDIS